MSPSPLDPTQDSQRWPSTETSRLSDRWTFGLALASVLLFYAYLLFNSAPKLEYDAMIFWRYAQQFLNDGIWKALHDTVPPREVGYPFFVHLWIRAGGLSHGAQLTVAVQLVLLFGNACASSIVVRHLTKNSRLALVAFLAVALSPAMLNAATSLYAECLAGFLFAGWTYCFLASQRSGERRIDPQLLILSAVFASALMLTRAAYFHVFLMATVLWTAWCALSRRLSVRGLLLAAVYLTVALAAPIAWMARNERVAGGFSLADHGGVVLYGRYHKSLSSYSFRDVLGASLNSMSESACRAAFGDCTKYGWEEANLYGYVRAEQIEVKDLVSTGAAGQKLMREAIHGALFEHPIRFFLFGWFELVQLVFFETASTGAVEFKGGPLAWLEKSKPLRGVVHFGLSLAYLIGTLLLVAKGIRRRVLSTDTLAVLLVPIIAHFFVYAMATTVLRYSFVIAPVYIPVALLGLFL